jgi:hypothetical protein
MVSADLVLKIPEVNPYLSISPALSLDLQYRVSKFIKMPRGTLELQLQKLEDFGAISPVLEFRLGKQRISIH